jgi:SAM-dependent methyltransferase
MVNRALHHLSSIVTRWFSENYGRHLIGQYVSEIDECATVLDLGPGSGDDLLICRDRFPAALLIGVESHEPYVFHLESLDIKVITLNIERGTLPLEDGSVDVIILNQILEHIKEVFWVLHECSRVLKKGGTLIVGVPNLAAWHNRLILLLGVQPPAIASLSCHVRGFTGGDLAQLLQSGGLNVEQRLSAGFYPFPPFIARLLAKLLPNLGWSIHMLARKNTEYHDEFLRVAKKFTETQFYLGDK